MLSLQDVQQQKKKLQEQGEQLRSAERCVKDLQIQLMAQTQADSTAHKNLAQVQVGFEAS